MNDSKRRTSGLDTLPPVAGNGLLDRRALLGRGVAIAGATAAGASLTRAAAEPLKDDPWSGHQGSNVPELETRSRYEDKVRRILSNPNGEPRTQHARTPHHMLNGTITPNPLHFVIIHNGTPDIDPGKHRLVIHGLVKQPMVFTLYQNGERLMPGNGYPMRLLLPGFEGNMNVKFLRRIKLVDQPAMTYYEARNYSPIIPGGKAYKFYFHNEVKSFITPPPFGPSLKEPGYYEISGIAYSGTGRIDKVMVSADGGTSWAEAALQGPVNPKAFTRFHIPFRESGGPAVLTSRAWDDSGNRQPLRGEF